MDFLVDFEVGLTMGRVLDRGDEREIFLYAPLRYPKPSWKVTPTVGDEITMLVFESQPHGASIEHELDY